MLKAVVDTNLFVSGLISQKGAPARLLELWRSHAFLAIISENVVEEVERVLQYHHIRNKYNLKDEDIEQALNTIRRFAVVLPDEIKLDVIKEDPDDNKILACALTAQADYIVSGDNHLLALGKFGNIPIVTAKVFLEKLEASGNV